MINTINMLAFTVWGMFRQIFIQFDRLAFGFIDNAYDLIDTFASARLLKEDVISTITTNMYVIIGIFALFRMAVLLVNSILDPDKLTAKDAGISKVFFNFLMVFVLLVATPIVFNMGYEVQEKVVGENYIPRIFINVNNLNSSSPGKELKNIALGSLLSIDKALIDENGVTTTDCSTKCGEAVKAYNDMAQTGEFDIDIIDNYIDESVKIEGETVYVYNYIVIVSTVIGIFITYILLSFAIDIALRMVELVVLQLLAPLFIVTYIDPKSAKSGPFSKWLKMVGKTYASLFIKLGIIAIMFLLISLLNDFQLDGMGAFAKLVLLIGILMFAKKAPKWIGDMFGADMGGGFSIGKKIKDEMLGGKLASKAGLMGAGAAMGAAKTAHANRKAYKKNLGEDKKRIGNKFASNYKSARGENKGRIKSIGKGLKGSMFNKKDAVENLKNIGKTSVAGIAGVTQGVKTGFSAGKASGNLKELNLKTTKTAKSNFEKLAPGYSTYGERISNFHENAVEKMKTVAFGDAAKRYEKEDLASKVKTRKKYYDDKVYEKYKDELIGGTGDFMKKVVQSGAIAKNLDDAHAMAMAKILNPEVKFKYDGDKLMTQDGQAVNVSALSAQHKGMLSPSGVAHFDDMYNKTQTNSINEFRTNQETISSETQKIASINQSLDSLLSVLQNQNNKMPYINQNSQDGILRIEGINTPITIDPNNLDGLKVGLNAEQAKCLDNIDNNTTLSDQQKAEEKAMVNAQFSKFEELVRIMTIKEQSNDLLDQLLERQTALNLVIENISPGDNLTLDEKIRKLAATSDGLSKKIKALDEVQGSEDKK